jgi:hypothetical protein
LLVVFGRDLPALVLTSLVVAVVAVALFAEDRRGADAWTPGVAIESAEPG